MRGYLLLSVLLVLLNVSVAFCGCTEASINVTFEIPEDLRSIDSCKKKCSAGDCQRICENTITKKVSLRIFRPPSSNPFGCDDLAFGDVTADVLDASLTQEIFLGGDSSAEQPFVGIDRLARKVLLAQALDKNGEPLLVGCRVVSEIADNIHLDLKGEPATKVDFGEGYVNSALTGEGLPPELTFVVTDVRSKPLPNVEVRWEIIGPASKETSGRVSSDSVGKVQLFPVGPNRPGPQLLEIRVRWQRGALPLVMKGFILPASISLKMEMGTDGRGGVGQIKIGRIGPDNEMGVVGTMTCSTDATKSCLLQSYLDLKGRKFVSLGEPEIPGGETMGMAPPIAVIPVSGESRDRIITLSGNTWMQFDPRNPGWNELSTFQPPEGSSSIGVLALPACPKGNGSGKVLVTFQGKETVATMGFSQNGLTPIAGDPLRDSKIGAQNLVCGCLADKNGLEHQVVSSLSTDSFWQVTVVEEQENHAVNWPALPNAVGFSPAGEKESSALLLARFGMESPEIARLQLVQTQDPSQFRFEEISSLPAYAVPETVAAGDLDGDGGVDVVGVFLMSGFRGFAEYIAQITLAVQHRGKPLSGLVSLGTAESGDFSSGADGFARAGFGPVLWVADFDGDQVGDLVVWRPQVFAPQKENPCVDACDLAYEECLSRGDPSCKEQRDECERSCNGTSTFQQVIDVYPMGPSD